MQSASWLSIENDSKTWDVTFLLLVRTAEETVTPFTGKMFIDCPSGRLSCRTLNMSADIAETGAPVSSNA